MGRVGSFLGWNERQNAAFTSRYQVLTVDIASAEQKKMFLGEGEVRVCRYCGGDSSRTIFREQSHCDTNISRASLSSKALITGIDR